MQKTQLVLIAALFSLLITALVAAALVLSGAANGKQAVRYGGAVGLFVFPFFFFSLQKTLASDLRKAPMRRLPAEETTTWRLLVLLLALMLLWWLIR